MTQSIVIKKPIQVPRLKKEWILIISVIPQLVMFFIPGGSERVSEEIIPVVLIISLLGMILFMGFNISIPGFSFLATGLILNFLAIISNRGWMPISPGTLYKLHPELPISYWNIYTRLSTSKDLILPVEKTNLYFLTDIIPVPAWVQYKFAFSIGDIIIILGVILLIVSIGSTYLKERYYAN